MTKYDNVTDGRIIATALIISAIILGLFIFTSNQSTTIYLVENATKLLPNGTILP